MRRPGSPEGRPGCERPACGAVPACCWAPWLAAELLLGCLLAPAASSSPAQHQSRRPPGRTNTVQVQQRNCSRKRPAVRYRLQIRVRSAVQLSKSVRRDSRRSAPNQCESEPKGGCYGPNVDPRAAFRISAGLVALDKVQRGGCRKSRGSLRLLSITTHRCDLANAARLRAGLGS